MCVLWGIPYLLIKVAVEELSPPVLVLGRTAIGAAILLPIAIRRDYLRLVLPHWRILLVFTAIEVAGPWLLLNDAERHLTSSFAGLLIATTPLVAAIASSAVGYEAPLDRGRLLGLAVGLGGVAALLGLDLGGQVGAGIEIGFVILGYGIGPLIISKYLSDVPSLGVMAVTFTLASLFYAPIAPFNWPTSMPSTKVLLSVLALGLLCTVAAFLVFFALIAEVGPSRATVITFVNPAVAVLLGILLLDEPFTAGVAVGFPLVLLGCWLATRQAPQRVPALAEP
jgi:drug/metabolite transporter (DMT)-like permease